MIDAKPISKEIKLGKVCVTNSFRRWDWHGIELSRVTTIPPSQIISAVVEEGSLYLVYWYEEESELKP